MWAVLSFPTINYWDLMRLESSSLCLYPGVASSVFSRPRFESTGLPAKRPKWVSPYPHNVRIRKRLSTGCVSESWLWIARIIVDWFDFDPISNWIRNPISDWSDSFSKSCLIFRARYWIPTRCWQVLPSGNPRDRPRNRFFDLSRHLPMQSYDYCWRFRGDLARPSIRTLSEVVYWKLC